MITVTIKYTRQELELLINSLTMTCTTQVPTEDNGLWKKPYESLLKDLKRIKQQCLDKEKEETNGKEETESYIRSQDPAYCETCE